MGSLSDTELNDWAGLHQELASGHPGAVPPPGLLEEMNSRVYKALQLRDSERILVEDFVRWNMRMVQGKVEPALTAPPDDKAAGLYLKTLKAELDAFVGDESGMTHAVRGVRAEGSAMLSISLVQGAAPPPTLSNADNPTAEALAITRANLLRRHSQWLYFERCLQIFEKGAMYLFKPLETIQWTRRQAVLDAQEIIAKTFESQGR